MDQVVIHSPSSIDDNGNNNNNNDNSDNHTLPILDVTLLSALQNLQNREFILEWEEKFMEFIKSPL